MTSQISRNSKISPITYCRNFPKNQKNKIGRDNLYEVVDKTFEKTSIVFIDGDSLTGKTEFLAEYMRNHSSTSIGVFLNTDGGIFYSADYVRLALGEQILCLNDTIPNELDFVDENDFKKLIFRLQKLGNKGKITFVIDGLVINDSIDFRLTEEISALLPIGQREFQFLISGNNELLTNLNLGKWKPLPVSLIPISFDEVKSYLKDLELTDIQISAIRQFTGGVIGQVQKIKQFINDGIEINDLLSGKKGTLDNLFEFEWVHSSLNENIKLILAYVVFTTRLLDLKLISQLTNLSFEEVEALVKSCKMLVHEDNGFVTARSEAQRKFISNKLIAKKQAIHDRFISHLLESPLSKETTLYLPSQLVNANKYQEVINHLDSAHFVKLLETEQSLQSLKKHAEYGLSAARNTNNDSAEIRFSLINSTLTGLTFTSGLQQEVETLFKLGMEEKAYQLALIIPTCEERLKLLASIGKSYANNNLPIPDRLKDEINNLVEIEECRLFGPLAVEIASDLLTVNFQMGIKIFQSALDFNPKQLLQDEKEIGKLDDDKLPELETQNSLNDNKSSTNLAATDLINFSNAVAERLEDMDYEEFLQFSESISEEYKLYVYKRWLEKHKRDKNAWIIVDKALDLIVKGGENSPKIRDLREISVILPHVQDQAQLEKLLVRIQTQKNLLKLHGTSEESVRLEMLLLLGKNTFDSEQVKLDLIDLYISVNDIEDISVRATCLAWMLNYLKRFPNSLELDESTTLVTEVKVKLIEGIEELLESTADHYVTAKDAIIALAKADPILSLELINKLNNQTRRDQGLNNLVMSLIATKDFYIKPDVLLQSIDLIENEFDRDRRILFCLHSLEKIASVTVDFKCDHRLLELWEKIRMAPNRLKGKIYVHKIKHYSGIPTDQFPETYITLLDNVTTDWVKTDVGYWAANQIADIDKNKAEIWMEEVRKDAIKRKSLSQAIEETLISSIKLAIRTFAALTIESDLKSNPSFARLTTLIQKVSTLENRIVLWTDLAIKLFYMNKKGSCDYIVKTFIQQLLNEDFTDNGSLWENLILRSAPAIYLCHPATFDNYIGKLTSIIAKDTALINTCKVIFRKISIFDPYQVPVVPEYSLSSDECNDILHLLRLITTDSAIYDVVDDFSQSVSSKNNHSSFRRNAAIDFLDTLIQIALSKLPDNINIKHDGYRIACMACVYKAKQKIDKKLVKPENWNDLAAQVDLIPNVSDKAIVLAIVGVCSGNRGVFATNNWAITTHNLIVTIPSIPDRIERFGAIARIVAPQNKIECKKLLSDAMLLSKKIDNEIDAEQKRKKILDFAHNFDPKLADILIDLLDEDEAKSPTKKSLKERVDFLQMGKDVAANPSSIENIDADYEQIADISRKNLALLNSSRIPALQLSDFKKLAYLASNMPVNEAFHVWSYILQNQIKKADKNHLSKNMQPMFDSICLTAELVLSLAGRTEKTVNIEFSDDVMLGPGDRKLAFERIQKWVLSLSPDSLIRISDPYFGPSEVELIKSIAEIAPNAKIEILTSKENIKKQCNGELPEEAFNDAWVAKYDVPPPNTVIHVIGFAPYGKHPVHDRWILSENTGIRLGSSMNSLGLLRVSEISDMNPSLANSAWLEFDHLVNETPRYWEGERLTLSTFSM